MSYEHIIELRFANASDKSRFVAHLKYERDLEMEWKDDTGMEDANANRTVLIQRKD